MKMRNNGSTSHSSAGMVSVPIFNKIVEKKFVQVVEKKSL